METYLSIKINNKCLKLILIIHKLGFITSYEKGLVYPTRKHDGPSSEWNCKHVHSKLIWGSLNMWNAKRKWNAENEIFNIENNYRASDSEVTVRPTIYTGL